MAIIVPVHDGADTLRSCLEALLAATTDADELIVIDDGSEDQSGEIARQLGVRVITPGRNEGAAAARNRGVAESRAPLLCFVDADVVIHADALERLRRSLLAEPKLSAVFGSYDDAPAAQGVVSRYRNLLHHHTHQRGRRDAVTFWTGLGAIRRCAFEAVGGFDDQRFAFSGMEDVDLGDRLRSQGLRIALDPSAQGKHLKAWSLWSMIRTDVLHRAVPWGRLVLQSGFAPTDLNLSFEQRTCVALTLGAPLLLWASVGHGAAWWMAAMFCWLAVIGLNARFFALLHRRYGPRFAIAAVPLHLLHYAYSGLAFIYVLSRWTLGGPKDRPSQVTSGLEFR